MSWLAQTTDNCAEFFQDVHLTIYIRHERSDSLLRKHASGALRYERAGHGSTPRLDTIFAGFAKTAEAPAHLRTARIIIVRFAGTVASNENISQPPDVIPFPQFSVDFLADTASGRTEIGRSAIFSIRQVKSLERAGYARSRTAGAGRNHRRSRA